MRIAPVGLLALLVVGCGDVPPSASSPVRYNGDPTHDFLVDQQLRREQADAYNAQMHQRRDGLMRELKREGRAECLGRLEPKWNACMADVDCPAETSRALMAQMERCWD